MLKRTLARIRHELASLLLECAAIVTLLALSVFVAVMAFILSAQLYRLVGTREWRAVPFTELLEQVSLQGWSESVRAAHPTLDFLFSLPAPLVLFAIALPAYAISVLLLRLRRRESRRFHGIRQSALIADIERELEKPPA